MKYCVVAMQRTGSSLLNEYVYQANDRFGSYEFFLDKEVLHSDGAHSLDHNLTTITLENVLRKFDYLEDLKSKDVYFPIKVIPKHVIKFGDEIENRLKDYLNDFKILTILRNPFDTYLSQSFQESIAWKVPHNKNGLDYDKLNPTPFYSNIDIEYFISVWLNESRFIFETEPYHVFKYEDINIEHLNNYFNISLNPSLKPMNIDYKSLLINYDMVYDDFHFTLERKVKDWKKVFGVNVYNEDL